MNQTLMRKCELLQVVPLGRTQLNAAIKAGAFPKPIKLTDGGRRICWIREEVEAWVQERRAERDRANLAA